MGSAKWEASLVPGSIVEARWTNSYSCYTARAEVVRVNKSSIRVRLLEQVETLTAFSGYPVGHEIVVPSMFGRTYSANNCVAPLEGKE